MAKIRNINGTSENNCKCLNWLKHWEKFANKTAKFCSESSCIGKDIVGAHVQRDNSSDMKWYIVPLCQTHNKSKISLEILSTTLVSANVLETCGS